MKKLLLVIALLALTLTAFGAGEGTGSAVWPTKTVNPLASVGWAITITAGTTEFSGGYIYVSKPAGAGNWQGSNALAANYVSFSYTNGTGLTLTVKDDHIAIYCQKLNGMTGKVYVYFKSYAVGSDAGKNYHYIFTDPDGGGGQKVIGNKPYITINAVTATVTQTHTSSSTKTQTTTPTVSPTITETSTKTVTKTVTETSTTADTATITPTITITSTKTVTQTVTETHTSSSTKTNTETITQTSTPTSTRTITPTLTMVASYVVPVDRYGRTYDYPVQILTPAPIADSGKNTLTSTNGALNVNLVNEATAVPFPTAVPQFTQIAYTKTSALPVESGVNTINANVSMQGTWTVNAVAPEGTAVIAEATKIETLTSSVAVFATMMATVVPDISSVASVNGQNAKYVANFIADPDNASLFAGLVPQRTPVGNTDYSLPVHVIGVGIESDPNRFVTNPNNVTWVAGTGNAVTYTAVGVVAFPDTGVGVRNATYGGYFGVSIVGQDDILQYTIVDSTGATNVVVDRSGSLAVLDGGHIQIHEKNHWTYSTYDSDLDTAEGAKIFLVGARADDWHLSEFSISADQACVAYIYASPTVNTLGTAFTWINDGTGTASPAPLSVGYYDSITTGAGTQWWSEYIPASNGGSTKVGAALSLRQEKVLKANVGYLFSIIPLADNTKINVRISGYEATTH